ncbi:transglutaminase domain-containing protein [Spongiactinospora rosea]|uniref:Transglutaminase domain-containing protein n=1 Tax=Spongiactinospora rosea TaxID=2248750 RepID=A0A366M1G2_9ACTN|nr:transglutaminase-like domain-containing protein [Spongiactinospora rosea]RBQ19469.1 transglutaminase domain-containing protein [Spongiactinospora rosea]
MLDLFTRQSRYSDPGPYAALLDGLPADPVELSAVVRNVLVHYRASGLSFVPGRLAEIDGRWLDRILAADQSRNPGPLTVPRAPEDRVAGCCRDFTLLMVAALRHQGVPARSRVGLASYLMPGWNCDHVVAEYWDGERWVLLDAQLEPAADRPFDPADVPRGLGPGEEWRFMTAARAWTAFRAGELDADTCGVDPSLPMSGEWFLRDQVVHELAHRRGDELLLWDAWGMTGPDMPGGPEPIDEVAALLLAAEAGDTAAEPELARRYSADAGLRPGRQVICLSPTGRHADIDLDRRTSTPRPPSPAP